MKAPLVHISSLTPWLARGGILVRTDGLLGDNVVASRAFPSIFARHPGQPVTLYNTYPHNPARVALLADLFQELIADGKLVQIMHKGRPHGPLTKEELAIFRRHHEACYDCGPFEAEFLKLPKTKPWLGRTMAEAWQKGKKPRRIGLFRISRFHAHFAKRNLSWPVWEAIERNLHSEGWEVEIFGWDDNLPHLPGTIDSRRRFSVHETLEAMAACRRLISTTTFCPHFCQHYIPCLVISDPEDIVNLRQRWAMECEILDATEPHIPDFVRCWMAR